MHMGPDFQILLGLELGFQTAGQFQGNNVLQIE